MTQLFTENRPWGYFTILYEGPNYKVKKIVVKPGHRLSLQLHRQRREVWTVVQGMPHVTCGASSCEYNPGEFVVIPQLTKHRLENRSDTEIAIIEVQCGDYLGEDDIVRFEDDYQRA